MAENSPFDTETLEDLYNIDHETDQIKLHGEEVALVAVRTFVILLVLVGAVALAIVVYRRKRGSPGEVMGFTSIQIIWQALAWYKIYIDFYWVQALSQGTVDSEHNRKVYVFFENLFHGMAVYSGVALVARLEGLVGVLLWMLLGMSVVAPLVWAIVILLLDLTMTSTVRLGFSTQIGVAAAKMAWLDLIPLGLLFVWCVGQCRSGLKRAGSTRENASKLIAATLVLFHLLHIAQFIVYCVAKYSGPETEIAMISPSSWLHNMGHLAAALAIPWAWLAGLFIPRWDATEDQTELNLKLAKQNKARNIVKYKKNTMKSDVVDTPPTTPYKFQPEVTSSPSAHSQEMTSVITRDSDTASDKLLDKSKRNSYLEAVSMGSLNFEIPEPVVKSKSVDPLWLPSSKPLQV